MFDDGSGARSGRIEAGGWLIDRTPAGRVGSGLSEGAGGRLAGCGTHRKLHPTGFTTSILTVATASAGVIWSRRCQNLVTLSITVYLPRASLRRMPPPKPLPRASTPQPRWIPQASESWNGLNSQFCGKFDRGALSGLERCGLKLSGQKGKTCSATVLPAGLRTVSRRKRRSPDQPSRVLAGSARLTGCPPGAWMIWVMVSGLV